MNQRRLLGSKLNFNSQSTLSDITDPNSSMYGSIMDQLAQSVIQSAASRRDKHSNINESVFTRLLTTPKSPVASNSLKCSMCNHFSCTCLPAVPGSDKRRRSKSKSSAGSKTNISLSESVNQSIISNDEGNYITPKDAIPMELCENLELNDTTAGNFSLLSDNGNQINVDNMALLTSRLVEESPESVDNINNEPSHEHGSSRTVECNFGFDEIIENKVSATEETASERQARIKEKMRRTAAAQAEKRRSLEESLRTVEVIVQCDHPMDGGPVVESKTSLSNLSVISNLLDCILQQVVEAIDDKLCERHDSEPALVTITEGCNFNHSLNPQSTECTLDCLIDPAAIATSNCCNSTDLDITTSNADDSNITDGNSTLVADLIVHLTEDIKKTNNVE